MDRAIVYANELFWLYESGTWIILVVWFWCMNYSGCIGGNGVMVSPTGRKTGGHKYGQTALATTIIDDQWVEIVFDK